MTPQQQTAVENGPVMEKLLRELVHARNQLARENGFDSFADYGDLSMQRLGYGRAELDEFCRQVQKYITPPVSANAGAAAPAAGGGNAAAL